MEIKELMMWPHCHCHMIPLKSNHLLNCEQSRKTQEEQWSGFSEMCCEKVIASSGLMSLKSGQGNGDRSQIWGNRGNTEDLKPNTKVSLLLTDCFLRSLYPIVHITSRMIVSLVYFHDLVSACNNTECFPSFAMICFRSHGCFRHRVSYDAIRYIYYYIILRYVR